MTTTAKIRSQFAKVQDGMTIAYIGYALMQSMYTTQTAWVHIPCTITCDSGK